MELYQLEYFLEASRQRSFTRAAARLNLAQAALSEQMRKLEAELGAPLFHRARRGSTLTSAGELLRRHAETILAQAETARRSVRDLVELRGGRLVVAAIPSVSACLLPGVVSAFRRKHPEVELSLLEGTSDAVAQWVESGRAELGVVQAPAPGGAFETSVLFDEPFVLLVPAGHRLSRCRSVKLTDLSAESFVFYKGRARDAVQAACREAGYEPRVACESGELETIRSLVASRLGVALLPALAVGRPDARCAVVRLSGTPVSRRVVLLQRRGQALAPAAIEFRRLLGSSVKSGPARLIP